mmetsp:Transcript_5880/g.18877  ORF Transcript_5880/g.18877 Transcript_5880/m.18877 type:complete len:210 (-) Transcript_5880:303-932(-)
MAHQKHRDRGHGPRRWQEEVYVQPAGQWQRQPEGSPGPDRAAEEPGGDRRVPGLQRAEGDLRQHRRPTRAVLHVCGPSLASLRKDDRRNRQREACHLREHHPGAGGRHDGASDNDNPRTGVLVHGSPRELLRAGGLVLLEEALALVPIARLPANVRPRRTHRPKPPCDASTVVGDEEACMQACVCVCVCACACGVCVCVCLLACLAAAL